MTEIGNLNFKLTVDTTELEAKLAKIAADWGAITEKIQAAFAPLSVIKWPITAQMEVLLQPIGGLPQGETVNRSPPVETHPSVQLTDAPSER